MPQAKALFKITEKMSIKYFVIVALMTTMVIGATTVTTTDSAFATSANSTDRRNLNTQDPIVVENLSTSIGIDFPIVDYGYNRGIYIGPNLNPITIAQQSILAYEQLGKQNKLNQATGEILERDILVIGDWLKSHVEDRGNYSVLPYSFPWPYYNMSLPWYSGMAHGKAIQALMNAYKISGDVSYVTTADNLLNAFFIEVRDGGLSYKDTSSGWWYEEYSDSQNLIQPRVLNGMMFALQGIYDLYNTTNSNKAKFIFDQGVRGLKINLHKYDVPPTSLYDSVGKTSSPFYHDLHIRLLRTLYSLTGDPYFQKYSDLWESRQQ